MVDYDKYPSACGHERRHIVSIFLGTLALKRIKQRFDVRSTASRLLDLEPQASNGREPWLLVMIRLLFWGRSSPSDTLSAHLILDRAVTSKWTYLAFPAWSIHVLYNSFAHASACPLLKPSQPALACDSFVLEQHFLGLACGSGYMTMLLPLVFLSFNTYPSVRHLRYTSTLRTAFWLRFVSRKLLLMLGGPVMVALDLHEAMEGLAFTVQASSCSEFGLLAICECHFCNQTFGKWRRALSEGSGQLTLINIHVLLQ